MGDAKIPPGGRSYQLSDQFRQKLAEKGGDQVINQAEINELSKGASVSEQQFIAEILTDKSQLTMTGYPESEHRPNQLNFSARIERDAATASPEAQAAYKAARPEAAGPGPSASPASPAAAGPMKSYDLSSDFVKKREALTKDGVLDKKDIKALAQGASESEKRWLKELTEDGVVSIGLGKDGKEGGFMVVSDFSVTDAFLKKIQSLAKDGRVSREDIDRLQRAAASEDEKAYLKRYLSTDRYAAGMPHLNQAGKVEHMPEIEIERQKP